MRTIWKYPFIIGDSFALRIERDAKILLVDDQGMSGSGRIWAEVDTEAKPVVRHFRLFGTGHEMPEDNLEHVGSWTDNRLGLVWHLYEELS